MSQRKLYLAIDSHARNCVRGYGCKRFFFHSCRFSTCDKELIAHVKELDAGKQILTLEESSLAYWISRTIHP